LEVLVEQLAARDPDPVVAGGHVDHVRRVDVDIDPGRGEGIPDGGRVAARYHRAFPALRVAEEELGRVRTVGDGLVQRVVDVEVGSDTRHAPEPSLRAQAVKPPRPSAMASPTNPAMMPATIRIRCSRVAEIICTYSPTRQATRPVAVVMMTTAALVWVFLTSMPRTNETRPTTKVKMVSAFWRGWGWPSEFRMLWRRPDWAWPDSTVPDSTVPATLTTSWLVFTEVFPRCASGESTVPSPVTAHR